MVATEPVSAEVKQRLETLRTSLLERRARLHRHLHHRDEPLPADFSEQATELENHDAMLAIDAELARELRNVGRALLGLERGDYGSCAACGEAIAGARLDALPEALLCSACARREAGESAVTPR